ncbi:MAG: DsbA family oxidoreductase [Kofleriaceae bacterium]|nr:DsbA family oxidoreductase [Kofleriaceae bacterium]MBP9170650.1 DsbA family oxidoreductase [Kofleriaceae bacterium]MBP9860930.1 DsbA family oxidoreductase [Kofleriaceae bacterium]
MATLRVDVWSDVACPWCYVGKRRFERALIGFAHAEEVEVVWRAFELDPRAPARHDDGTTYAGRLAAKYRRTEAQAQDMLASMTATAATEGIAMRFDRIVGGNTFDAHRALALAAPTGHQGALKERLLRAHFCDGRALGDVATVLELAVEVGMDGEALAARLAAGDGADQVRADQRLARELGITGVPFFVIGGRIGVSGAQPADVLVQALAQGWDHTAGAAAAGPSCDADGCA